MDFLADSIKLTTRESDNSIKLTFSTGEYQQNEALKVFQMASEAIRDGQAIKVSVEADNG